MPQPQQVPSAAIAPMRVHPVGWYALQGGGELFWDGDEWADYVPPARDGDGDERAYGVLDAGAVIAGLIPMLFLILVTACVLVLPL